MAYARYVDLNLVRAELVKTPEHWEWSSARAHLAGRDDFLASVKPMLQRIKALGPDWQHYWQHFLAAGVKEATLKRFHMHTKTGRPLGSED